MGNFANIASLFCGDQFVKGNPKILMPGETVEDPSVTACLEGARSSAPFSEYQFRNCVWCCDLRADHWNERLGKNPLEFDQKLKFLNACNNNCRMLDPLATPPPRYTSLADRRGEQCASQYGEGGGLIPGCSECCSEAAKSGDIPPSETRACNAVCMREMYPILLKNDGCCKVPISDTGKCPVGTYEYGPAAKGTPGNFCLPMSCTQPSTLSGCPGT